MNGNSIYLKVNLLIRIIGIIHIAITFQYSNSVSWAAFLNPIIKRNAIIENNSMY